MKKMPKTSVKIEKRTSQNDKCKEHKWYDVYKGDYVTGRRCEKCNKQEWF